jgi:hypothetical protein
MRTITYKDEAAPWSRLLPSSGDSDNIFSGTPAGTLGLRYWSTRTHLWLGLFRHTFVPCPQFFCLLKPIAHVCTPKIVECLLCLFPYHVLSPVINFLSLPSPCLFFWHLEVDGRTWHMESQEFGSWVQNSGFIFIELWIHQSTQNWVQQIGNNTSLLGWHWNPTMCGPASPFLSWKDCPEWGGVQFSNPRRLLWCWWMSLPSYPLLGMVVHACNLSFSVGWGRRITSSRPAWAT